MAKKINLVHKPTKNYSHFNRQVELIGPKTEIEEFKLAFN